MEELIKYFEALEARLKAQEARIEALEAEVAELKNRPLPEPQVIEKEVIKEVPVEKIVEVEKPVEVIKEVIVEKPVEVIPETPETPAPVPTPEPEPEPELFDEPASPKAAIYGKAVDDIRLAISLGDRFLYQRELFGQNGELMQRTLTELNNLGSFDEALAYIARFGWDTESSTYQQFLVTLHRRFG